MDDARGKANKSGTDHRSGHRARLRARFLKSGEAGLAEYELLELLLCAAIPRRDVKPLAKDLIASFGSYADVLKAPAAKLAAYEGLGEGAVALIKAVDASVVHLTRAEVKDRPIVSSWDALISYLRASLAHESREQVRVLYLDRKNVLIADEGQSEGTIDHAPLYPREVVRRALELHASALILVHNHPSGDPKPSRDDIAMTREVAEACDKLGITLHDHIVVGKHGHASFKTMGLL